MPLETTTSHERATRLRTPQLVYGQGEPGGTLTVHPAFESLFAQSGLKAASCFLALPGEVVSGHPDRHVIRLVLPGSPNAFYLKRQHVVGWREKLRNWRAGFGYVSRSEREAALLQELEARQLPVPRWAAFGTHGGRAFVLIEEKPGAVDLRRLLSEGALSLTERRALAAIIGNAAAAVHDAGFTTPDLTAKHILVDPNTLAITLIDWQSAAKRERLTPRERADALGALHASLAAPFATPDDRLRSLSAYRQAVRPARRASEAPDLLRAVLRSATQHAQRRSVREQLHLPARATDQRLIWVAEEAVCAVPEIAAKWPRPAIAAPFYGFDPEGRSQVRFGGHDAVLVRGHSFAPLSRLRAWLRATPWRSPGVTIGRVLFHLERYGIAAPRLFAFGQRLVSATCAEWFALYEQPAGVLLGKWRDSASGADREAIEAPLRELLNQLHAAGCVLVDPAAAFAVWRGRVAIADPQAVRIVRRVRESDRRRDERLMFRLLGVE